MGVALCGGARAQTAISGNLTLASDNRFRGVSLSDNDPDLRAGLAIDDASGWYAGASLSRAELWPGHRPPQWLAYGGRSRRLDGGGLSGLTLDLGATYVHFASGSSYDYAELYAGLSSERLAGRVFVSPDYFGRGMKSVYAELEGNLPLPFAPGVQAVAHIGAIAVSGGLPYGMRKQRADGRVGLAWTPGDVAFQLAWVTAGAGGPYPAVYSGRRSGWVASATLFF